MEDNLSPNHKKKNKEYGKVNQDAQKLIDMLRNDAEERKGFSKIKTNSDNQLTGFCFMSRRMKKNKINSVRLLSSMDLTR